jgi:TonB family protein
VALDRPAWGSITASNPFPPLPSESTGPYLALRFRFYYNPDKTDLQDTPHPDKSHLQDTQQQFGSFDGSWEGDLIFLQGATLSQKDQTTVRYRISIQGMKVRVFVVRPEDAKEIKPSKFHVDFLMTNAVVYAMESGHDNEGTWVETWVFTLTQIDKDTVLTNFSRMVNNLDLPLASDHSKFAKEAAGKLRRISDDNAGKPNASTNSAGPGTVDLCKEHQGGKEAHQGGSFTERYPWYVHVIQAKVTEEWMKYEADPHLEYASRACFSFDVSRTGEPSNVRLVQSSGVPRLDESVLRALNSVSSFGPLPIGYERDKVSIAFYFDYKPKQAECTAEDHVKSSANITGENGLRVQPEGLTLALGKQLHFRADAGGSFLATATWSIEGEQCKANDCGSVSELGLYTAPPTMPPSPEIALKVKERTQPCRIGTARLTLIPEDGR